MYLQILKKDLKRKKTMNIILLVFIMLASMFIASSANNMITIFTALDKYFEKAGVPDYWTVFSGSANKDIYKQFAKSNNYVYGFGEMIRIDTNNIRIDNKKFEYSSIMCITDLKNSIKVFDSHDNEITEVADGEIYITSKIFHSDINNFEIGGKIQITVKNKTKVFKIKDYMKEAICGSSMLGMSKFIISENDINYFKDTEANLLYTCSVNTDDPDYSKKLSDLDFTSIINVDYNMVKMTYVIDLVLAALILVVSICIILISMVILKFTIKFTISEEFSEIGVMKAIGIKNKSIRWLYIIKYLAVSATGSAIGCIVSIPFGNILLRSVSKNIVIYNSSNYFINIICAFLTAIFVILFCYLCTNSIKKLSPISAIRNGELGERYMQKSVICLEKFRVPPVLFMAVNDILSGIKRYISMIAIFTLGILLVIIPLNTANTVQSDNIIKWFNMAECDHVISQDILLALDTKNIKKLEKNLYDIKNKLAKNNIRADVFREVSFTSKVIFEGTSEEVLSIQGMGEVDDNMYSYIEGMAPVNSDEIAISNVVSEKIGAKIGDSVQVKTGDITKNYIVTAINQSMNNVGRTIRFSHSEDAGYAEATGVMGIQVKYKDNPDSKELAKRKVLLKKWHSDDKVYTAGEYINFMIGDVAGQINSVKNLILAIVIGINILVTVLMVKSFIIKEMGEIVTLKSIGFKSSSLIIWQTVRIGIVLFISLLAGIFMAVPISQIAITPIFRMMGAYNIEFEVKVVEVYLVYPLLVFAATSFFAFLSSQGLRKIKGGHYGDNARSKKFM